MTSRQCHKNGHSQQSKNASRHRALFWVGFVIFVLGAMSGCDSLSKPDPTSLEVQRQQLNISFGGVGEDVGHALAKDRQGNLYLAGYFNGTVNFGSTTLNSSGGEDVFVVKMDANENILWARRAGGTNVDRANGIAVDEAGNIYVSGSFFSSPALFGSHGISSFNNSGDAFLAKLDNNGNWLWARAVQGTGANWGIRVALDNEGRPHLAGKFQGTATFGTLDDLVSSGNDDVFIAKLDPNGNWLWAKKAGGPGHDQGWNVAVDGLGNVYLLGRFESTTATFGPTVSLSNSGGSDVFIAKLDPNGNWLWAKKAGGPGYDQNGGLAIDSNGNPHIIGYFSGTISFGSSISFTSAGVEDIFIAKLDTNGQFLWAKRAGGSGDDRGHSLIVDSTGKIYATGEFSSSANFGSSLSLISQGNTDVFVVTLDAEGTFLQVKSAGGNGFEHSAQIAIDGLSNLFLTGSYQGSATFDSSTFISQGDSDIFVWKTQFASAPPPGVVITSIEGTGSTRNVNSAGSGMTFSTDAIFAKQRFQDQWILRGTQLDQITDQLVGQVDGLRLVAKGISASCNDVLNSQNQSYRLSFLPPQTNDEGATTMRRVQLPTLASFTAGVYCLIAILGNQSVALAQTFVLQGDSNPALTALAKYLHVDESTGTITFKSAPNATSEAGYTSGTATTVGKVVFSGVNVHVQNGAGTTESANSTGNLVIGYNEPNRSNTEVRTGSHNLVMGVGHTYPGYANLISGAYHNVNEHYSATLGGGNHTLNGSFSGIVGGDGNTIGGRFAGIVGGQNNLASGWYATVTGGAQNVAQGNYSSISGGQNNKAEGYYSSISGGGENIVQNTHSSISGGKYNLASGTYSSISGGALNRAYAGMSSVSAGKSNVVNNIYGSISGGEGNTVSADYAMICGGHNHPTVTTAHTVECSTGPSNP